MARQKKSARSTSKFPSRHAGYVSPKADEPVVSVGTQVPVSLRDDLQRMSKELGYRSNYKFLLMLLEKARDEYQRNGKVEVKLNPTLPKYSERQLKKAAEETIGSPS